MPITKFAIRMTLTEEQMNAIADEFENDTFQHEDAPVYTGSHYRVVNNENQSVTVIYDTKDVLRVNNEAKRLGCSSSDLNRAALHQ